MATNVELRRSNGTNYNEVIHFATSTYLVEGLLDDQQKIKTSWLPSEVFGGMHFVTGITLDLFSSEDITLDMLAELLEADFELSKCQGKYFIVGEDMSVYETPYNYFTGSDDGIFPDDGIHLEAGDWIVCQSLSYNSSQGRYEGSWGIINNTYRDATTSSKGVIQLATDAEATAGTNTTKALSPATVKKSIEAFATPKSHIGTGGASHAVATGSVAGFMSAADKAKLDGIASGANNYVHPTFTGNDLGAALVGAQVISDVDVNSEGHVTSFVVRDLKLADLGYTGATNANYYIHPSYTARNVSPTTTETIANITVDASGHVTTVTKQAIATASSSSKGLVQLAIHEEGTEGTDNSKATTPAVVVSMIEKFASIPLVTTLSSVDASVPGKLVMLEV